MKSFSVPFVNSGATDLFLASAQFFDVSTWITLGAALLISTAAFVIMRLYVQQSSARVSVARHFHKVAQVWKTALGRHNGRRPVA